MGQGHVEFSKESRKKLGEVPNVSRVDSRLDSNKPCLSLQTFDISSQTTSSSHWVSTIFLPVNNMRCHTSPKTSARTSSEGKEESFYCQH